MATHTNEKNRLNSIYIMCTLKENILKKIVFLYLFNKSNTWHMHKRQVMASVCCLKENKRWRYQFLQIGTLTEFKRYDVTYLCQQLLTSVKQFIE